MNKNGAPVDATPSPAAGALGDAQPVESVPTRLRQTFPTVAIGASAGGVETLVRLFTLMPADAGCAFIVVMHLAPGRDSALATVLGRTTRMHIEQAEDRTRLESNHVYIIPPGQYLEVQAGELRVRPMSVHPPKPMAVDQLMISLAADQREQAIGIVLTGTGGDGAIGVKAIKSEGGMTIAQSPKTATYPDMPESAIATGHVDQQLTIEDIPAAIVAYVAVAGMRDAETPSSPEVDLLRDILAKYTADDGEISVTLQVEEQTATVRIRDSGLGLAPGMEMRVFELFVQDERAIDRSQGGLGIGLALVRHLVQLHGGTVEAHSEGIGRGSAFVVRLRTLQGEAARSATATGLSEGGSGRVMIVDDDLDGGESTTMLLRLFGYEVEHAVDLDSALRVARTYRPQVVLMDIAMPGADGCEVMRRLRAMPEMAQGATFIAVSGFGQPEDFRRSAAAGFAHHLVKPVNADELNAVLKKALGSEPPAI